MPKKLKHPKSRISPKTPNHQEYWDNLTDKYINYLVCTGLSGTGKTTLACKFAAEAISENKYNKIYIITPMVEVDNFSIGWLPGDLNSKTEPHLRRITQHLDKFIEGGTDVDIEALAVAYIRGMDLSNKSLVICDESQNFTLPELKAIFTRIGTDSKLVILGDFEQNDMKFVGISDLEKVCNAMNGHRSFKWVELGPEDIVRSKHLAEIIERFDSIDN